MKKFFLGYIIGSVLSSIVTDYFVRSEIFFKLTSKYNYNEK